MRQLLVGSFCPLLRTPGGRVRRAESRNRTPAMLESNNPEIDVDDLMSRIQREAARWQSGGSSPEAEFSTAPVADMVAIETWLNDAAAKTEVRTRWSARMDNPLFRNGGVQRVFLRVLAFVFRDQRHVNLSLIAALRAFVSANRELAERVTALEHETHRLGVLVRERDSNSE
jgi:hypothetical protein